ncbi:peptidoglycan editing factor PgeF [Stenoxybacter acetivorans]|uniref:peptidoglycan editing factor PgeF n=1 Tax=Stenoxybacter acetivorans TaxID=422441 RepID=UPI001FE1FB45|nr:peptidoglycan editing factor PgeF [Stenoxybacter acetivorans]
MNQQNMNMVLGFPNLQESFFEADWQVSERVHTLISTRKGGVSKGVYAGLNVGLHVGDNAEAVMQNRAFLQNKVSLPIAYLNQTHGIEVVRAQEALVAQQQGKVLAADACVAFREDKAACAVMTADCLPILLCDEAATVVAAVHAGWRSLAAGIVQKTITAMNVPPQTVSAYLGPAIGKDAFEVGEDVQATFCRERRAAEAMFTEIGGGKYLADIAALARLILAEADVYRVYGGDYCTVLQRDAFFSYRRDGVTGRMLSAVWLAED